MSAVADVVVVGGGLGGLSAALAAAERGMDVRLIERDAAPGGAVLLSAGSLWTFPTVEDYLAHCPSADPMLAELVVSSFEESVAWLERFGVELSDRGPSLYGPDTSRRVDPHQLVRRLAEELSVRAEVHLGTQVTAVEPHDDAVRVTAGGTRVEARAVVLATGGVHGDPSVLRAASLDHYVGLPLRNRPRGGDGASLALAGGASLAGTADGIYGHLVPAGLPSELLTSPLAAQYHSVAGVLVGVDGELLSVPGTRDHDLNRLVARVRGQRAVLVHDAAASPFGGSDATTAGFAADRTAFALSRGGRVATADSVAGLVLEVAAWGIRLQPDALEAVQLALRSAPFSAVVVEPTMTHPGVGIAVDASLHVTGLDHVRAAGADVGRAFGDGYGGGISFALTTGIAAGRGAAGDIAVGREGAGDIASGPSATRSTD